MRVYPDANIYLTYLLGRRGEGGVQRFFDLGLKCKFVLIVSTTTFAEVQQGAQGKGSLLLQRHIDEFQGAGKIEVISRTPDEVSLAVKYNDQTAKVYGVNDYLHALMARNKADIFVSDDLQFRNEAKKFVCTMTLKEFLSGLEP